MSAVVDFVNDVIDVVVAITVTVLAIAMPTVFYTLSLLSEDFKDFVLEQMGVVMSWLGIEAEDIIETFVSDQRLLPDATMDSFITQLALKHELTQFDIIDIFAQETAAIRNSFNSYYNNGETEYSQGLPTTTLSSLSVPNNINTYIDTEYGITSVVLSPSVKIPTKDEYLAYQLHNNYNYYPAHNTLEYLEEVCPVTLTEYNFLNDEYDITITRATHTITETTVTISAYIEAYTTYSGVVQYSIGDHVMYDNGVTVAAYKAIQATLGNLPTDTVYWELVDYDNKNTTTTVTTSYDTGGIAFVDVVSEDVLIPSGSEVDSYVTDSPGVEGTEGFILHEPAFIASNHFVIQYYDSALTSTDWVYWIYKIGSGTYPILDDLNLSTTNLNMLPIIELRRSTVNINNDKLSPSYLETKAILDLIGVDVDLTIDSIESNPDIDSIEDAYIYFGLDIKDESPLVAKMVYDLFAFMYYDNLDVTTGEYKATISEGAFNASLTWSSQTKTITSGTIGPIGTNQITTGVNITVSRQETANQYVTYTMTKMSSLTLIDRDLLWGATVRTAATADDTIVIPLSFFFIDNLTPLEQVDIFNRSLRLSVYSAIVTHLEWYETEAFLDLVKIIVTAIGVVLFILSLPAGGAAGSVWMAWGLEMLVYLGAAMAFQQLMQLVDNPWLKALAVAAAIYVGMQYGKMDTESALFFAADQITTAITMYSMAGMEALQDEMALFGELYDTVIESFEQAEEAAVDYLTTEFVALLSTIDPVQAYIEGPDLQFYRAVEMQYDWDLVKGGNAYATAFDYDKYYKLGIT